MAALNGSAAADPSTAPYSCRAAAAVAGLRAYTGIGDAPVLMPLQPWLPPGASNAAAVLEMQHEQLALLPAPGGLSLDTVTAAVTNDLGDAAVALPGGPAAPSNTLPVAVRLALAADYMAWWNYGRVGSG